MERNGCSMLSWVGLEGAGITKQVVDGNGWIIPINLDLKGGG